MGNHQQKLVTRIAMEVLAAHSFRASGPGGAQNLWGEAEPVLHRKVRQMRPATLGIIAAAGAGFGGQHSGTPMYEVHCEAYLGKYQSGKELLQVIAMTAIVAEMWDILVSREPQRDPAD